jgi:hypothetical protein
MKPPAVLITLFALAVISNARVALAPGWVVPVPAVFLAIAVIGAGAFAALIVVRQRVNLVHIPPATPPAAPAPASGGPASTAVA